MSLLIYEINIENDRFDNLEIVEKVINNPITRYCEKWKAHDLSHAYNEDSNDFGTLNQKESKKNLILKTLIKFKYSKKPENSNILDSF